MSSKNAAIFAVFASVSMYSSASYAQSMQDFAPFVSDSFKCQSSSDRGATCDRTNCTSAPSNYAFWEKSLKLDNISSGGRNNRCTMSFDNMRDVEVSLSSGEKATLKQPGKICVNAHAETGSGAANIGRTAWTQCQLSGKWVQYR